MNKSYKTEQEEFWAGSFGEEYIKRNQSKELLASNLALFTKMLKTAKPASIIEFGANIGMNLQALETLLPNATLSAIEINKTASEQLQNLMPAVAVHNQSILEFDAQQSYDLVLIKGVLIHINPAELPLVYQKLYDSSSRYILVAEYYNPSPVEINYRGHSGRLFKRDFSGEMLNTFEDLRLVDYGFQYHKDPVFPADDITWFLMEKMKA
ncbi:pseudaminic acid biosynthesis-associated methylase [Peijinzhouia sedimentorum]